jgi:hypothetical protein
MIPMEALFWHLPRSVLLGSFPSCVDPTLETMKIETPWSCSPAEPMSASPVLHSFSLNLAAVQSSKQNYRPVRPRVSATFRVSLTLIQSHNLEWREVQDDGLNYGTANGCSQHAARS